MKTSSSRSGPKLDVVQSVELTFEEGVNLISEVLHQADDTMYGVERISKLILKKLGFKEPHVDRN